MHKQLGAKQMRRLTRRQLRRMILNEVYRLNEGEDYLADFMPYGQEKGLNPEKRVDIRGSIQTMDVFDDIDGIYKYAREKETSPNAGVIYIIRSSNDSTVSPRLAISVQDAGKQKGAYKAITRQLEMDGRSFDEYIEDTTK